LEVGGTLFQYIIAVIAVIAGHRRSSPVIAVIADTADN
jgi:hypothetical protein